MYRKYYLLFWVVLLSFAGCSHKDTILRPLAITGFSPTSGLAHTLVTISGIGFDPNAAKDIITFNGVTAKVIQVGDTALVAEAPDGGSTGPLRVRVGNIQLTAGTYSFQALSIHGASPLNGPAGTNIRISGAGFSTKDQPAVVLVGGVPASITSASDSLLIAAVPATAATGAIQVLVNGDTALGPVFLVQKISSIHPTNGGPGTVDTIRGSGFGKNNGNVTVTFNGKPAIISSINDSVIIAAAPASVTTGPVSLTMNGQQTVGPVFAVAPVPVISVVSPLSGPAGTAVTITGKNFSTAQGANAVDFNGVPAVIVSTGSSKLLVTAPTGAKTGLIHVSTNGQSVQGPIYTYQSLNITAISPDNGLDGTSVTITGNNFSVTPGATEIYFNGKPGTITGLTATSVTATVPDGVTTGAVTVQVNGIPATGPVFRRAGVYTLFTQSGAYFSAIAVDGSGNIYVSNTFRNNIIRIAPDGSSSAIFAGSPTGDLGLQQGNGTNALFNSPAGLATDVAGNLYVGDENNNVIRRITPAGDVSTWLVNVAAIQNGEYLSAAGNNIYLGLDNGAFAGTGIYNITGGTLSLVSGLKVSPGALAADAAGDLFYTNHYSSQTASAVSEQLAGGSVIPAFSSGYNNAGALAIDPTTGNVLVGEAYAGALYSVTPDGVTRTTLVAAGSGNATDGNLNQASFIKITAMTTDQNGVLYLIDNNNTIRKVVLK